MKKQASLSHLISSHDMKFFSDAMEVGFFKMIKKSNASMGKFSHLMLGLRREKTS